MSLLIGWIIFVAALLFSIMLHELGHFATAKWSGMKVSRFFLGFGNTVWSFRRGETEYGVKSMPVGGYVKIVGMTSLDEVDARPTSPARSAASGLEAHHRHGGRLVHALRAGVLPAGRCLARERRPGSTRRPPRSARSDCVPVSAAPPRPRTRAPAATPPPRRTRPGIRPGDKIVAIDGTAVHSWAGLGAAIRAQRGGQPVAVTVLRDGKQITLHATLRADTRLAGGSYLGIEAADASSGSARSAPPCRFAADTFGDG